MDSFLPEGYEVPKSEGGNYMKFEDGANKFRILSPVATIGYEYWNTKNKPVRLHERPKETPEDIRWDVDKKTGESRPSKVKHFWAFAVWNYKLREIQILEITQQTIQNQINDYYILDEYGDPRGYDLNVNRKGEGFDTEYSVQAFPPKPAAGEITAAYESKKINLDALFDGGNPFEDAPTAEIEAAIDDGIDFSDAPKSIRRAV